MNGRRAVVGLCMLCALLVSAFAAQSASAAGTTAVTCAEEGLAENKVGSETFNTAHCLPGEGSGNFEHYKITEKTELTGQAGSPTSKLKATIGGVATTLTSTSLTGTGFMENKKTAGGEHFAHGTGTITYSGVTVSPFEKCFVYEDTAGGAVGTKGVVKTQELTATTEGTGKKLKFTPAEGTVFARFWILDENEVGSGGNCKIPGTYSVSGSVLANPEGATASTTHAGVTADNTLKMGTGEPTIKAGIEGSLTIEGSKVGAGAFKPLSVTTF